MKNTENKFEAIIESYINGNITWVKSEVKKLSKINRKLLYEYSMQYPNTTKFFFELI